jgi:hypothetical protein
MSIGTVLVTIALMLVVTAYLTRPFRKTEDLDRAIEAWVAQVESKQRSEGAEVQGSGGVT